LLHLVEADDRGGDAPSEAQLGRRMALGERAIRLLAKRMEVLGLVRWSQPQRFRRNVYDLGPLYARLQAFLALPGSAGGR
jgi:hypothetical protein